MEALFPLESSWVVALAAGALALLMLLQLARSLPVQNIAMIAASLLAGEGLLEWFMAKYGWVAVTGPTGYFLAGAALLWLAVVLSARRLGQLILRPWRRGRYYGLWLIAVSTVLTASFQFVWPCLNEDLDTIAIKPGRAALLSVVRGLTTMVLLCGLAPWFIRKRPVSRSGRSELAQQPENEAQ